MTPTVRDAAVAWLRTAERAKADLPIPRVSRRRYDRSLREVLGFKDWPKDILRHTAASHLLATRKAAAAVALELGNSPQIPLKHYRELVTASEAAAFRAMRPSGIQSHKLLGKCRDLQHRLEGGFVVQHWTRQGLRGTIEGRCFYLL